MGDNSLIFEDELMSDISSLKYNFQHYNTSLATNIINYTNHDIKLYIEYLNKLISEFENIKNTCFSVVLDEDIEGFYIIQKMSDEEFKKDSFICTNELEFYIMNLENLLLQLKDKNLYGHPILYSFESHSITVYFIKLLERMGFVRIKDFQKNNGRTNMDDVSLFFLNEKNKVTPSYFISFELTDKKIDFNILNKINVDLGINEKAYICNEGLGVFVYNRDYQKEIIKNNTFRKQVELKGIVRSFDKNITLWNLPFQIIKKELNYLVGYALHEAYDISEKVFMKKFLD